MNIHATYPSSIRRLLVTNASTITQLNWETDDLSQHEHIDAMLDWIREHIPNNYKRRALQMVDKMRNNVLTDNWCDDDLRSFDLLIIVAAAIQRISAFDFYINSGADAVISDELKDWIIERALMTALKLNKLVIYQFLEHSDRLTDESRGLFLKYLALLIPRAPRKIGRSKVAA